MGRGGTYQKNHPSGVVSEDDQANGDEAKSHHLVCPGGLEKKEGSAGEMPLRDACTNGVYAQTVYTPSFSFIQQLYTGADYKWRSSLGSHAGSRVTCPQAAGRAIRVRKARPQTPSETPGPTIDIPKPHSYRNPGSPSSQRFAGATRHIRFLVEDFPACKLRVALREL